MRVGDLFKIGKGSKVNTIYTTCEENFVRFIQIEDLRNDSQLKYTSLDKGYTVCSKSDFIIAWDGANAGTIGHNLEGVIGSTLAVLIKKRNDVTFNTNYVGWYLKSKSAYLRAQCNGATIPHIQKSALEDIEIPLPKIDIQDAIATALSESDSLIQKRKEAIAKLDGLVESIFLEMFGEPTSNTKKLETDKLKNLIQLKGGFAFKSSDYVESGIPLVRIGNANKTEFNSDNMVFLDAKHKEKLSRFIINPGDLLITLTGTVGKVDYGNVCMVSSEFNEWFLNQRISKIDLVSKKINKAYLYFFLLNRNVKNLIIKQSRGVRQANLNNDDIYNIDIPLPSSKDQELFSDILNNVVTQKKANASTTSKTRRKLPISLTPGVYRTTKIP